MSHPVVVRPIRTEEDFDAAVSRVSTIIDAEEGTPEFDEIQVLAALITEYEHRIRPVPDATPVELVRGAMVERCLTVSDLAIYFGRQPRVSEFLAGKRELTVEQIRRLSEGLGIPAAALIGRSEPRWRVPANRLQYVFDVVSREPLPDGDTCFRLRGHFASRQISLTTRPNLPNSKDYEVLIRQETVYQPPDADWHVFACEVVGSQALVEGYHR